MSWLVLASLLLLEGCDLFKKSDPKPLTELEKLPPATQTGKNTIGCLINGKAFVPATTVDVIAIYQQGILDFRSLVFNPDKTIKFVLLEQYFGVLGTNSYPLNIYPLSSASISIQLHDTTYCYGQMKDVFYGVFSINKLDRVNYIISGKFEFKTVANIGCDTLNITDGRFDVQYIP